MELYWETASWAVTMVTIGITACLLARFLEQFLKCKRCAWEAGGAYVFVKLVCYYVPWEIRGMLLDAVGIGMVFAVICLRDKNDQNSQNNSTCFFKTVRNPEQKIFLAMVLHLIEWFAHGISSPFRDILFRKILFDPKIMDMHVVVYFSFYVAIEVIYLILRFGIMLLLFHVIAHVYVYKKEDMSKSELRLMLSVPLSVLAGYLSFTFFFDIYLADINQYIQENHIIYLWIKALYQTISFVAIFSSIILYQKIKERHRQEKEEAVLKEQTESLKRHMSEVESLYQDIRGLKHDIGNHIVILENLCQNNRQEAIGYLSSLKDEFQEVTSGIRTGNPITDVIFWEKEKEARKKGIDFFSSFHYPEDANIDVFDISIILTNAIENAIAGADACQNPFIRVHSYQEKSVYLIEVRNNFTGMLLWDGGNEIPVTTKKDKTEHGFGLANIRRVAKKYFGEMEVRQEGDVFLLSVMLQDVL